MTRSAAIIYGEKISVVEMESERESLTDLPRSVAIDERSYDESHTQSRE